MVGEGATPNEDEAPDQEAPKLAFRRYAIAFHFAARRRDGGIPQRPKSRAERGMDSYEDDMLLYAHRDKPPFWTRVVDAKICTQIGFAPEVTYHSEGETKRVRCFGADETGRRRTFALALGETVFERSEVLGDGRSPLGILSLVLTPLEPGAEASELNEYDVIKLAKLWEGGEGDEVDESDESDEGLGVPSAMVEGVDIWFGTRPGKQATLHRLAGGLFPEWQLLHSSDADVETTARRGYRVGTIELELFEPGRRRSAARRTGELFSDLAKLEERREAPKKTERWDRAVAVGGILQGLLDFRAIEEDELADVFADVDVDAEGETMLAVHKGTLLSISGSTPEDEEERPRPLGVDPYLAVPNIVLLHNEQRLKNARQFERELSEKQRSPVRRRAAINATENGLSEMARLLAQDLPNVFHYSSERQLQKLGRESRGLDDLHTFVRLRMDDLSSVLESRVRRRDRWTAVLGIAVGVITAFLVQQAIQGRPLWLVVIGAGALFGAFLWLRDKLF